VQQVPQVGRQTCAIGAIGAIGTIGGVADICNMSQRLAWARTDWSGRAWALVCALACTQQSSFWGGSGTGVCAEGVGTRARTCAQHGVWGGVLDGGQRQKHLSRLCYSWQLRGSVLADINDQGWQGQKYACCCILASQVTTSRPVHLLMSFSCGDTA